MNCIKMEKFDDMLYCRNCHCDTLSKKEAIIYLIDMSNNNQLPPHTLVCWDYLSTKFSIREADFIVDNSKNTAMDNEYGIDNWKLFNIKSGDIDPFYNNCIDCKTKSYDKFGGIVCGVCEHEPFHSSLTYYNVNLCAHCNEIAEHHDNVFCLQHERDYKDGTPEMVEAYEIPNNYTTKQCSVCGGSYYIVNNPTCITCFDKPKGTIHTCNTPDCYMEMYMLLTGKCTCFLPPSNIDIVDWANIEYYLTCPF